MKKTLAALLLIPTLSLGLGACSTATNTSSPSGAPKLEAVQNPLEMPKPAATREELDQQAINQFKDETCKALMKMNLDSVRATPPDDPNNEKVGLEATLARLKAKNDVMAETLPKVDDEAKTYLQKLFDLSTEYYEKGVALDLEGQLAITEDLINVEFDFFEYFQTRCNSQLMQSPNLHKSE